MKNSGVVKLYHKSGDIVYYRRYNSKYDRNLIVKKLLNKYQFAANSLQLCFCPDEPDIKETKGFVVMNLIEGSGLAKTEKIIAEFEYASANERFLKIKTVYEKYKLWNKNYTVNINPLI